MELSLRPIEEQGYLVLAVNSTTVDYVACASRLAFSIKRWHAGAKTCLLTDDTSPVPGFDFVRQLPMVDRGNAFANESYCFRESPFRETIKLEADQIIVSDITHWWTMLRHRDMIISTGCNNIYGDPARSRFYRKVFDQNHLPDVYSAVTYWRLSETARDFFQWVKRIFADWPQYKKLLTYAPDRPDTDLVYAMAAQIMGPEKVTMPFASYPKITHMKQHIIGTQGPDWTKELVWEYQDGGLRINTVAQWGAFHYYKKTWQP